MYQQYSMCKPPDTALTIARTPRAMAKTRFRVCPRCTSACLHSVIHARVICVNCGAGIVWLASHEEGGL